MPRLPSPAAIAVICSAAACGSFGASETPGAGDGGAANDGGGAGDGGAGGSFCPRAGAYVCEDFEAPNGFRFTGWKKDDENGRNAMRVEENPAAISAPHVLHVIVEPGATTPTDAYLEAQIGEVSQVTLETNVRVDSGGAHHAIVAAIQADAANPSLRLRPSGELEERLLASDGGVAVKTLASFGMLPAGEWTHVVLAIDIGTHTGTATVGGQSRQFALDPVWAPGPLGARVGLVDASDEVRWDVFVDDVLVTAR